MFCERLSGNVILYSLTISLSLCSPASTSLMVYLIMVRKKEAGVGARGCHVGGQQMQYLQANMEVSSQRGKGESTGRRRDPPLGQDVRKC